MSKSKLVKNNVESVSKEIKNEAEVIHENLSADEQTLSDVKDYGRCEQVPDMRSSYSSGAHPRGTS
ncbi:hypothetical protein MZD03_26655 [Escherichia coli]|uniref:hypothetical protein n=1 Tax=Escherichia coli TaxID=562 RepID=UPI00128FA48F|nr:hypothetical protein [Escherichia coli]MCQ5791866.1 hypothetical protein [Escherichia coli]MCQ5816131.1 hypothetical protein [Escherichia coli]MCQ5859319.1 hypothetical protein [Escherichia coli]MCQ5893876.1 hypothetical protein [Escherichia coli]MCQ5899081.1 hypothetical protein [Escherichia coli]